MPFVRPAPPTGHSRPPPPTRAPATPPVRSPSLSKPPPSRSAPPPPRRPAPAEPEPSAPSPEPSEEQVLAAGMRVRIQYGEGTIRFIGSTSFAPTGTWVGVELDEPTGKNDGAVKTQRYFTCAPYHGSFVRPDKVEVLEQKPARAPLPPTPARTAPPIGARVRIVYGDGIVRFVGSTDFASGVWVGVELDGPTGKNDGLVKGRRYFSCTELHGSFVKPDKLVVLPDDDEQDKKVEQKKQMEADRIAEKKKKEEEKKKQEEQKKQMEADRIAEKKKKEEEKKKQEEQKKQMEADRIAEKKKKEEEKKKQEEQKKQMEADRIAEQKRKEAEREREDQRKAEEERKQERRAAASIASSRQTRNSTSASSGAWWVVDDEEEDVEDPEDVNEDTRTRSATVAPPTESSIGAVEEGWWATQPPKAGHAAWKGAVAAVMVRSRAGTLAKTKTSAEGPPQVNYETMVQLVDNAVRDSALRSICLFPDEIFLVHRKHRVKRLHPKNILQGLDRPPAHLQNCARFFDSGVTLLTGVKSVELRPPVLDHEDEQLVAFEMEQGTVESSGIGADAGMPGRLDLASLSFPEWDWSSRSASSRAGDVSQWSEAIGEQLVVNVHKLSLALGSFEPLFGSLSLWDAEAGTKMTEDFHFDLNTPVLLKMLPEEGFEVVRERRTTRCLFRIIDPKPSIYLVLRVDKVLLGEYDRVADLYKSSLDGKAATKAQQQAVGDAQALVSRMSQFRQFLGWSFLRVYDNSGSLLLNDKSKMDVLLQPPPEHSQAALCHALQELVLDARTRTAHINSTSVLTGSASLRHLKTINGACDLEVISIEEGHRPPNVRDAHDNALIDMEDERFPLMDDQFIMEVANLRPAAPMPILHAHNTLYLLVNKVSFASYTGKARNISLHVSLRADEGGRPLECIYGRSLGHTFVSEVILPVVYHEKSPSFLEEVKIELPVVLGDQLHLFFSFHHVSVRSKASDVVETPIAFGWLPILSNGTVISGNLSLDVVTELQDDYLTGQVKPTIRLDEKKGKPMQVAVLLQSSLATSDPALAPLLEASPAPGNFQEHFKSKTSAQMFLMACQVLKVGADVTSAVAVLPMLLEQLLGAIAFGEGALQSAAFDSLVRLVDIITKQDKCDEFRRPSLLRTYIELHYGGPPVHLELPKAYAAALEAPATANRSDMYAFAWFAFALIKKSCVLALDHSNQLSQPSRINRFGSEMYEAMRRVGNAVFKRIRVSTKHDPSEADALNTHMAWWIMDLAGVVDRALVLTLLDDYDSKLHSNTNADLMKCKLRFYEILLGYEFFIPLCLPVPFTLAKSQPLGPTLDSVDGMLWERHMPVMLLVKQCFAMLTNVTAPTVVQRHAQLLIRILSLRVECEASIDGEESHQLASSLLFPWLHAMCTKWPRLTKWRSVWRGQTMRDALIAPMLLFKYHQKDDEFSQWVHLELDGDGTPLVALVDILEEALHAFQHPDRKITTQQSTGQSDDQAGRMMRLLSTEAALIILKTTETLMQMAQLRSNEISDRLQRRVARLHVAMLKRPQAHCVLPLLFKQLASFANGQCGRLLFAPPSQVPKDGPDLLESICQQTLYYLNTPTAAVRERATSFLFHLTQSAEANGGVHSVTVRLTFAISTFVTMGGGGGSGRYSWLEDSLGALPRLSKAKPLSKELESSSEELIKVLLDASNAQQMLQEGAHPDELCEVYLSVAEGLLRTAPEMRINWLQRLSDLHATESQFSQAAYALTQASWEAFQLLRQETDCEHISFSYVIAIAPQLEQGPLPPLPEGGTMLTVDGLIAMMTKAVDLWEKARVYEMGYALYRGFQGYLESTRDLGQLCSTLNGMSRLAKTIDEAGEVDGSRPSAAFYRVGFYGKPFGQEAGNEYIFALAPFSHLYEVQESLIAAFKERVGGATVEIIKDSKKVDIGTLQPKTAYIQLTSVDPIQPDSPPVGVSQEFFKGFNVARFAFTAPFTKSGKAHGGTGDQWLRRSVLEAREHFPSCRRRLLVASRKEFDLSPIEVSIEAVDGRVKKMKAEVEKDPPDEKTLRQILQGSVLLQVNAGPLEIADCFLGPKSEWNEGQRAELKKQLSSFLSVARELLDRNALLLGDEDEQSTQQQFQIECTKGYDSMVEKFAVFGVV